MSRTWVCGAGPSARRAAGACVLALGVLAAGCSTPERPTLGAGLYQSRMDVDDRQVQVKLHNEGDGEVVVERMALTSTAFGSPMVYRKTGSVLGGGRAVDMPVVLGDPVCDDLDGPQEVRHTVEVDYRLEDGSTGTVEVAATDGHGQVAALHAAECFSLDVAEVATLSVSGGPRVVTRGTVLTAELTVDVTAGAGAGRRLEVEHVGGTTLLQHVDPRSTARLPEGLEVGVLAPATGSRSFPLVLVPARCDAHAVAEDKQGTRFRVTVDLDGVTGQVAVAAPDPVKVALYDFVRRACAAQEPAG